jgi:phytoene dehydrogenase-like protein
MPAPVLVVGGGHNGLVAACYLARAGEDVIVLERSDRAGGGSRTEETVPQAPGYRFDTHSVAHNIINMTPIPDELDLAGAGLRYVEMDPFATGFFADGRIVRFARSLEETVASIAEHDAGEAEAYRRFLHRATPLVEVVVAGLGGGSSPREIATGAARRVGAAARALRRGGGPVRLARDILSPYGPLLERSLPSDLTRAPIAAFAAHSSAGPHQGGGGFFALWQAAYHLCGQWHAIGGAQALADALVARLRSYGGSVRTGADVRRIDATGGRVRGVELADGERLAARAVVAATDPTLALLGLLDPPLDGQLGADLRAAHRGNAVQMLVHLAVDRLPPYPGARPGDWSGLQSHVDSLDQLRRGFLAAEARSLPDPAPTYAFTTSALDDSLAPAGRHTVYLACPCAPFDVEGGWDACAEPFAEAMVDQMERHAPGFRASVTGLSVRTPAQMAEQLAWPGAHPMHLDITVDQLAMLRPTPALARHTVPGVSGLVLAAAGTAPTGGVAGVPGREAARTLLHALAR